MRRLALLAALALAVGAAPAVAQGPTPARPAMPGRMGPHASGAAGMLLAHTGELRLTDAQVVRLAAIARRGADRERAMHQRMRAAAPRPGTVPNAEAMQRMRQEMDQMREQGRTDLRDALAVLTPDQQATAWEMMAAMRGPGMRGREMRGSGAKGMRRPGGREQQRMQRRAAPPQPGQGGATPPPPPAAPQA